MLLADFALPNSPNSNFQMAAKRQPMIVKTKSRQTFNNTTVVSPKPLLKNATYSGVRPGSPVNTSNSLAAGGVGPTQTTVHTTVQSPSNISARKSPRQHSKKKRFQGNFVFRKKEAKDSAINPNRKQLEPHYSPTTLLEDVTSGGDGALSPPAISARIGEARYDENRLNQILHEDFVCLLDGSSNVLNAPEDEALAP